MNGTPHHPEIYGGSVEQQAVVIWAAGRFEEAGIDFPLPSISLHEGLERCGGGGGYLLPQSVSVHICLEGGADLSRKVLHEYVHAWDFSYGGIPLEVRSDFLARRGLNRWNDPGDDWPRRGAEQAAEIIAWGLQEEVGPIPTRVGLVGPQSLDDLATAFELLVGAPPLWMEADFGSSKPTGTWQEV